MVIRSRYIYKEDLLRFMREEEVVNVLPMFAGAAETGQIKKSSLRNWVVRFSVCLIYFSAVLFLTCVFCPVY